jgi:hypothetical protein
MHEKIYKAFHQDISIDDYKELEELIELHQYIFRDL